MKTLQNLLLAWWMIEAKKEQSLPKAHKSNQKTLNRHNPNPVVFRFPVFKAQNHHLKWLPDRVPSHHSPLLE